MLHPNQVGYIDSKKNNSIVLFFIIWFVMLSFRHILCGEDLIGYEIHFNYVSRLDFLNALKYSLNEPFYYGLNWLIAQLYPDFRLFIIITAFLCTSISGWFYWKESEFAPLTILLFITNACFAMFYSGLRQTLAILFIVPAYYLTKQKKIIPFILVVYLATFFHSSACVMYLLYPVFHKPLKNIWFVAIIFVIVFLFKSEIFKIILPFLSERYMDRYGSIVETNGYLVLIFFVFLSIYSYVVVDERKLSSDVLGLRNLLALSTVIQCFALVHPIAMRMNYYFIFLVPIIFPKIINKYNDSFGKFAVLFKWLMVFFLTFFFYYKAFYGKANTSIFPYVAYWE